MLYQFLSFSFVSTFESPFFTVWHLGNCLTKLQGKNDRMRSLAITRLLERVRVSVKKDGFDLKFNKELAGLQQEFRANSLPLDTFNGYLAKLKVWVCFSFVLFD